MKHTHVLIATFAAMLAASGPAHATDDDNHVRTVTVQGTGEAAAIPDVAHVTLGVVSEADAAAEALAANSTAMARLFAVLDRFGIAARDRQTSGFNVSPRYERNRGGDGGSPRIDGYRVSNQVNVRVRKLDDLGALLDGVVVDGANSVHGISFSLDDPAPVLDQARKNAIADATRRATLYAEALGLKVGKVLEVTELQVRTPRPVFAEARMTSAAPPVPVAAGEQEFGASITVVFEIDD